MPAVEMTTGILLFYRITPSHLNTLSYSVTSGKILR